VIETLASLATTRYVFELSIWLKLGTTREDYAMAYYGELLEKRLERAKRQLAQIDGEIRLLEELEAQDDASMAGALNVVEQAESIKLGGVRGLLNASTAEVDRRAARIFSLYEEQGKTNGFAYTAFLVREQAAPRAAEEEQAASKDMEEFLTWCPEAAKALVTRRWKWDREAKEASVEGAYDFLYCYVSRLLHATPASITTDQKHLEPEEIRVFLRYIYGALLDALDQVGELRSRAEVSVP
jgi:hypothetical protein